MKKLMIVLVTISCTLGYSQEKGTTENREGIVAQTYKITEIPKFNTSDIQKFAEEYRDFVESYIILYNCSTKRKYKNDH
jgi:hypothetical protein